MAELIWIFMWLGIAGVGSVLMYAVTEYFTLGVTKEEVIADIKDLLEGEGFE